MAIKTDLEHTNVMLTEKEEKLCIKVCPKCGSGNIDPAGGWNSANGWMKCYDCDHGPFWWLRREENQN